MLARWQNQWSWLFYVLLAGSTGFAAADVGSLERRAAIVALAAGLAVWYWRAVIRGRRFTAGMGRSALPGLVVAVALWAPLLLLHPLFQLLMLSAYHLACAEPTPLRRAIAGIVGVGALVAVTDAVRQGRVDPLGLMVLAAVTVALGLVVAMMHRIREQSEERRRLIAQLEATRDELAASERRAGALAERQRLAGDIHDTLAQGFASIVTLYEAARAEFASRPETALRRLEEVGQSARANLAEARRVVWALRPGVLEEEGSLGGALAALAADFRSETGIDARYTLDGVERNLGPEAEAVLLRVAQEALANVRKHARADRVAATLTYLDDVVMLDVRDDGVGFDPAPRRNHTRWQQHGGGFGLTAMRERMEQHGGTFTVESSPGAGTSIVAALPTVPAEPDNHPQTSHGWDRCAR